MNTREPFTCHDCGSTFQPTDGTCTTGYAVLNDEAFSPTDNANNHKVCYECALKRDLADAAETGKLFAYVSGRYATGEWKHHPRPFYVEAVTTWPGLPLNVGKAHTVNTWRSNFGDMRTAFSCHIATGKDGTLEKWHGLTYGDNGTYCRLRRAKVQS